MTHRVALTAAVVWRRSARRLGAFVLLPALGALVSCGGESGSEAAPAAASLPPSTLSQGRVHALAANSGLAVRIPQVADPLLQGLTIPADAATKGMWSPTLAWSMNGLHAALMPDGKVLTYGTPANTPGTQEGRTFDMWTPSLGTGTAAHAIWYDASGPFNSFCSTAAWLADGRLLVTGGNMPVNSLLMSPTTGAGTYDPSQLADQRWYATMITLPDSRNLILGGMDPYNEAMVNNPDEAIANGVVSMTPEVYTPGVGWRTLFGAQSRDAFGPDYLRASYPRAWVAPNGKVFGISSETMWWLDANAAGGNGGLTVAGKFKTPASNSAPVNVGATNSAVMFAPGRILQVGGNGYFNGDGYPASNMATVVDFNGAAPVLTETAPMNFARRYVNTVVLPDGRVLATGGTKVGNNGGSDAVYAAEIWNPATGAWTLGASAAQIRVYHSATLLLADGLVLSTGGGAPGPVDSQNAELYYPPYLFTTVNGTAQLATRPAMSGIDKLAYGYGATATVEMTTADTVARVVLLRNGVVTHSFNTGQNFQPLNFTQAADRLSVGLPVNANLAPPGYYQLIALNASGVPSPAVIVSLGMSGAPAPVLPHDQPLALDGIASPGMSIALDADGMGVLADTSAATSASAQFLVRSGLANAACVSLESAASPGKWLRHAFYRLQIGTPDGSALFNSDATFCPEAGLAGTGITLRSVNYPERVLHQRNGQIWLDTVTSDAGFAPNASFSLRLISPLPTVGAWPAAPVAAGGTVAFSPNLDASGLTFSWDFGDGSAATPFSASSAASHAYAAAGLYPVTLTLRNPAGATTTKTVFQAVYRPATANPPQASSQLLLEPRGAGNPARLWVVNPDNDSVSVFDTATNTRLAEVPVGGAPRSLALAADGSIWVVNSRSASISIVSAASLTVTQNFALPRGSQPYGIVVNPNPNDRSAWVTLEATGQLLRLNGSTGAVLNTLAVGPSPRHLSIDGAGKRLLVSRFITRPLPGEGTASVGTTDAAGAPVGGEVLVVDANSATLLSTVVLRHSDKTDTEISGSGIPNYLGAAVVSPDGSTAWVPSKLDNIKRGLLRNGQALNFQNTVRSVSSRIDLGTMTEVVAARVDHDNAGMASAATYDRNGSFLFVALETSRQVEVLDAIGGKLLFRIEAGLAPQALQVSADNTRLYVHNFMGRSIGVVDISPLTQNGELRSSTLASPATVAADLLPANLLKGKQLFYDARDLRLARDSYLSCASCHADAGHDGRVWDFSSLGEGLRNTIALKGRAGTGHGFLHWSANMDEVQDFEAQIRNLAGGTGLMADADFNTGSRSQPLGDKKAGLSADLDALAAYVGSLSSFAPSPYRNADATMTAAAIAGRAVFAANCASCHGGAGFTGSGDASQLKNIGTLKATSGKRLGGPLPGIDIPTLRDAWATAPYLHDGSAPTLAAAISAHQVVAPLGAADLANVASYVQQIGSDEPIAPYDLARGRAATQSSWAFGGDASRAVDGNTDGVFNDGSVSHTDNQAQPWWQVDLGRASDIALVRIWNRADCCTDRLNNFVVFVSAADMTGKTLAQLNADASVAKVSVASLNGAASLALPFGKPGRYVRVQLTGSNYLSLAEVEVIGLPANLALGKPATQSSIAFGGDASRVVDGNTDGVYNDGSVSHTDYSAQPWWQVDLGSLTSLDAVQIWNRTDCCSDRLSSFIVFVSPTDMSGKTLAQLQADATVKAVPVASLNGSPVIGLALGGASGRYLRVQLTGSNNLSLAEVQVFGR